MITNESPNRAEINDIHNTLLDGASGLVLAAETAIGKYPIKSALIIKEFTKILLKRFHLKKMF